MGCVNSSPASVQPAHLQQVWQPGFRHPPVLCRVIRLSRGNHASFGLQLFLDGDSIYSGRIAKGSPMDRWNEQHPSMRVGYGQRILSVSGIPACNTEDSWCAISSEFRKSGVELVVAVHPTRTMHFAEDPSMPTSMDYLLLPGFMDNFSRGTKGACNATECHICLQELEDDSSTVQLPCRHAFHLDCAEKWLTRSPTSRHASCPTCRAQLSGGGGKRIFLNTWVGADFRAAAASRGDGPAVVEEDCIAELQARRALNEFHNYIMTH